MATIRNFEDIISWREARKLNMIIGKLIDDKKFQHNYRLIQQVGGSAGSIMIILLRVLKEMEIRSLDNFFTLLKVPVAN